MKTLQITIGILLFAFGMSCSPGAKKEKAPGKPNVLFIAVDDLNDWVGVLGGYEGSITPNIDRLASSGTLFSNAYCAAPACNPSRAALMTGIRPSTSGVYFNNQPWRDSPVLKEALTIPQYFRQNGYDVMGSGKIYHGRFPDPPSWDEYWPSKTKPQPKDPMPEGLPLNGIANTGHFDWGPLTVADTAMGDWKVANWVIDQLHQQHDKPFFLACGIFRPHLPWYVPAEYFEKYPLDRIVLPVVKEDDHDDIPDAGRAMARVKDHQKVVGHNQWERAVQGYLASITFADKCVGRVIDALEKSDYKENTIVVLWSDHGWSLGEKHHWRKFALWEEPTKCVLIMAGPGTGVAGQNIKHAVNLLDVYPTLVSLCGLPEKSGLEGSDLSALMNNPEAVWDNFSVTTHGRNNHAVRREEWHYIRYADGSEELYNLKEDPMEWTNLAGDPTYADVIAHLSKGIPEHNVSPIAALD